LNAIERGQCMPSLEIAHRIANALDCSLDDVFLCESESPANNDGDGQIAITVRTDDEPEWWRSDDVSRVTTRA